MNQNHTNQDNNTSAGIPNCWWNILANFSVKGFDIFIMF